MKLKNPMLVVTDIDRSVEFYKKVYGTEHCELSRRKRCLHLAQGTDESAAHGCQGV